MVMEASPAAALEVIESQLILELLVIALDAPAQLGEMHEGGEGRRRRQGREPILGGFRLPARPFDEQPLLGPGRGTPLIAVGRPHPDPGEARAQGAPRSLAPRHPPPRRRRHGAGQLLEVLWEVRRRAPPVYGRGMKPVTFLPAIIF